MPREFPRLLPTDRKQKNTHSPTALNFLTPRDLYLADPYLVPRRETPGSGSETQSLAQSARNED